MAQTTTPSQTEMQGRIARFGDVPRIGPDSDPDMPLEARDVIYSRQIMPVLAQPGEKSAWAAPIKGAAGLALAYAACPPGLGPALHRHVSTFETFTVLSSTFEFRWGDTGEESVKLEPYDVVSFPPGIDRAFRNVGDEPGLLQVLITGGIHDLHDIAFNAEAERLLNDVSPEWVEFFKGRGFTFGKAAE